MSRYPRNIFLIIMLAAGLAFSPGCAEKGQVKVDGGQARTTLSDDVYRDTALGVYWVSPRGWEPMKGGEEFLFGWQRPDRKLTARCVVFGGGSDPAQLAEGIAEDMGWQVKKAEPVSWMGKSAALAIFAGKDRMAVARLVEGNNRVFAIVADAPAKDFDRRLVELSKALDSFRITPPYDIAHLVKRKSETLALVSLWYTGSAGNWPKLKTYNKLKAEALRPGMEIKVPRELVWRDDPLPPWAWRLTAPKARAKKSRTKPGKKPAPADDDLEELKPTGPK